MGLRVRRGMWDRRCRTWCWQSADIVGLCEGMVSVICARTWCRLEVWMYMYVGLSIYRVIVHVWRLLPLVYCTTRPMILTVL